jgi:hypothetical protein
MRCEAAQLTLSASLDERTPLPADVRVHVDGCPICSSFESGAWRVRELARFELAPPVPDMVAPIMLRVAREAQAPTARRPWTRSRDWRLTLLKPTAVALVVGFVIGVLVTGGGLIPRPARDTSALAAEVPRGLLGAARAIDGYQATFDITELHWTPAVPRRTFVARLWFRAPESFRVAVRDTTTYPSAAWPRNDEELVTDGRAWRISGSNPCPRQALPACPVAQRVQRTVTGRPPFDPSTIRPTDVIVPMTVLAALDRADVIGQAEVRGRAAVAVRLAYQDATPLFQSLRFLGSWRPFFPQDQVVLWLDRDTWFPLRYEVHPAAGPERALWASQNGFPKESPSVAVFTATERSLDATVLPPSSTFRVRGPGDRSDEAFRDGSSGGPEPRWMAGLTPWRSGTFQRSSARPFGEAVTAYARGLSWITVARVSGWDERRPFGVGPFAESVRLANGAGFYEPASSMDPRRVALHTNDGEFLIETNLPRSDLFHVAGSLPVGALPLPSSWRIQRWSGGVTEGGLTPGAALSMAGFPVSMPQRIPAGFRASVAQVTRAGAETTVVIVYRRANAEMDGVGLVLTESAGAALSPPQEAAVEAVEVRPGLSARWSPQRHLLEWVDAGVYRSLASPGLTLSELLEVARSFREARP